MSKVVQLNKPQPKKPTQHSVTEEEALDAIYYFWQTNALEDINTEDRYYIEILLRKVANDYNILLEIDDNTIL